MATAVRGFDWREVSEIVGLDSDHYEAMPDEFDPDVKLAELTEIELSELQTRLAQGRNDARDAEMLSRIRQFVEALCHSARHDYCVTVFEGLALVEDDRTFIQFVSCLLRHLWT